MGIFKFKGKKENNGPKCGAVVVAAGSSTRMGLDKVMLPLDGVPVILRTLRAFEAAPSVGEIVVVTREDLIAPIGGLCREAGLTKVRKVVCGGNDRTQSVRLGTLEVSREVPLIAIHDGARPLITVETIERTIAQAEKSGAAAPAIPVKDTIKVVSGNVVASTPERAALRAVQTPQVFEASLIRAALQKALEDGAALTDDCSAVERLGMHVVLVEGDERNLKLTTPADIHLAECFLEEGRSVL